MKQFRKMTYPYVIWISVMIVIPMLLIIFYAFTKQGNSDIQFHFTLENFVRFISDPVFLNVLGRSFRVAFITTIVCLMIGYPAAYYIAKCSEGTKMRWILIITFPTWINMLVRTYAWIGILQDNGLINALLGVFGIGSVSMLHTEFAVILGMVYNFMPFMILQIYSSLSKLDKNLIDAAQDLGANRFKCFSKIIFPLSFPGVISGITLVFLPAVSSFYIPKLLGGGQFVLVGNVIESQFLTSGDWNFGSAISLIMAVIIVISMYVTKKMDTADESKRG